MSVVTNYFFIIIYVVSRFFELHLVNGGGTNDGHRETPAVCQPPPYWTMGGKDVMYDYLGNVTLVALMELQCSFCRNQISSLERLNDYSKNHSLPSTKILIIAPVNESVAFIEYYREILRPKGIIIIQESHAEPIWSRLRGHNNDFFIYDACGRLNYHVPYPQSFTYYHYTVNTIYSVHKYHKCGPCSGYPPQRRQPQTHSPFDPSSYTPKKIKAYIITVPPGYHPDDFYITRPPEHQHPYNGLRTPKPITDTTVQGQKEIGSTQQTSTITEEGGGIITTPSTMTTTRTGHKIRHEKNKKERGKRKNRTTVFTTTTSFSTTTVTTTELPSTTSSTTKEPYTVDEEEYDDTYDEQTTENRGLTTKTPENFDTATAQVPAPSEVVTHATEREDVVTDQNEKDTEEDVEDFDRGLGADSGQAQTIASATTTATIATTRATRRPRPSRPIQIHKPPNGSIECSSHSEMSCFHLQEKARQEPCCYKGVYLTAICSQDVCDSRTYHICCFQKYQQARYQCCHNDITFGRPDDFSKCCYNIFVEDDPCCPTSVAHSYWSHKTRITELCLPNIEVSYDGMVLEAVLKDKTNVSLELGKFKSLSYQCPAATKRNDFFYWEPDGPPKFENTDVAE